jgi:hypothetical protein
MKHLHATVRLSLGLVAMLFAASPSTASPIGFVAFDAGQGQTGDQYAFSVTNLSGGFAIFPEFQILDPIAFTDWSLTLDDGTILVDSTSEYAPGAPLGSIDPGAFLTTSGLPFANLLFPSTTTFPSLTFTALLSDTIFHAMDDVGVITTYMASSASITTTLLPSSGGFLIGGEAALLDVDVMPVPVAVPEPATWTLVTPAVAFMLWRRRRQTNAGVGR